MDFQIHCTYRTALNIRVVKNKDQPGYGRPGARFSKVPKLYGPFTGVTIPFASQERRGL